MPMIDFIRMVKAASQGFALKEDFEFIEFEDLSDTDIKEHETFPDILEIIARVKVGYEGTEPDSYKVLNLMIGDWVESHIDKLTDVLHARLKGHFDQHYPGSDATELDQLQDTAIWTDQLDYMPDVDENSKTMVIDIDLVLHGEPIDE